MKRLTTILLALGVATAFAACDDDDNNNLDAGADVDTGTNGTPRGADNPPTPGVQIDRMGRAAINTALNNTFNADSDAKDSAKDAYNADDAPGDWSDYQDDFAGSLAILDSLDTVCGNQLLAGDEAEAGRYSGLAGVLTDDQLYVNTDSGECGTYLGLEAEVVGVLPAGAGGCGGRTPSDDVIERSYSVLAAGALEGVDDTITADDGAQSDEFPFLGPPSL